jgi:hypothetical protein
MKRLFLSAVSFVAIAAAPAMAQQAPALDGNNTSIINQRGNGNMADVNQAVGATTNNEGYSSIEQLRGAAASVNNARATVRQSQGSLRMANGQYANSSVIEQRRDNDVAFVNQIHDYATSVQNTSTIRQLADDATASVRQRGDGNIASITQRFASVSAVGRIEQNGEGNDATITEENNGGSVVIKQGTWVGPAAVGTSDSWDNRATVVSSGFDPLIRVNQFGSLNNARVIEDGIDGTVRVDTDGVLNRVNVNQMGTDNVVDVDQLDTGFRNNVEITQEASAEDSLAKVEQSGYRAKAEITQQGGSLNSALVSQSGFGVAAQDILSTVLQDGASNSATVDQFADSALSGISQMGTMLTATVSQ